MGHKPAGLMLCVQSLATTFCCALLWIGFAVMPAHADDGSSGGPALVGTQFPAGFPVVKNDYLGVPVIGFGAARSEGEGVPVIFLHGNNDTPFATACNPFGSIHAMAQYFRDHGYDAGDLWGVGYQGDQCDLASDQTLRSGVAHSTAAAVAVLRKFVAAVRHYTRAKQIDIVGHSLGVTVAREWMLQDNAYEIVRSLIAIDGPNHGIIDCSPSPLNYWQLPTEGGFIPHSAICEEYGSDQTPLLKTLNGPGETPGPTRYLVIRNDSSGQNGDFVYAPAQDGVLPGVPAIDRNGNPHDFSNSALLAGAATVTLTGQGRYDPILGTSHLGILNSPEAWQAALKFLTSQR
jgi:pimeloyl-ACP methyl ester carboxylesterase